VVGRRGIALHAATLAKKEPFFFSTKLNWNTKENNIVSAINDTILFLL
jgi:hypothetical protein